MAAIFVGAVVSVTSPARGKRAAETVTGTVVAFNPQGVVLDLDGAGGAFSAVPLGVGTIVRCEHLSGAPTDVTDGASTEVYGHDARTMRAWLRAEGVEGVGARGRIHPDHAALFLAAHPA